MILEAFVLFGGSYIIMGLCMYLYAVVKTYQILGIWNFKITREAIGVCKYPYWTLFWLHIAVRDINKWKSDIKEGK